MYHGNTHRCFIKPDYLNSQRERNRSPMTGYSCLTLVTPQASIYHVGATKSSEDGMEPSRGQKSSRCFYASDAFMASPVVFRCSWSCCFRHW